MLTYHKAYTRDNGLIIQSSWSYAFVEGFKKLSGLENPFNPPGIYYINDGAVEIWDSEESINWFENSLLKKNLEEPEFFKKHIKTYKSLLEELEVYKRKGTLSSVNELKKFIDFLFLGSAHFVIFYYSAVDARTPKKIRDEAFSIREVDTFYNDCEEIIRSTLPSLFPQTKQLELAVVPEDLDKMPSREELTQRMKHFICIFKETMELVKIEDFSRRGRYKFVFDKVNPDIIKKGMIKGQSAYLGLAKGVVRVIKNRLQIKDFLQGEILVSPMTNPFYIPAIKKAAAIITDEGGITCHAAITARELKIPCIIGAKIATKVLKDGDLVEVDANKGVVRIIK